MGFNLGLKPSDIVTHRELIELFGVSTSGGMRRSLTKNTLVFYQITQMVCTMIDG